VLQTIIINKDEYTTYDCLTLLFVYVLIAIICT